VTVEDTREPAYTRPSEIDDERGWFDRLADITAGLVSRAPFFVAVLAGITCWFVIGIVDGFSNRLLNVGMLGMTLITLVLVALLENQQRRSEASVQRKLNAIADALADFMERERVDDLQVSELRHAVGLEDRESTHRRR
jgi:low affinity Fe/Cu permease